MKIAYKKHINTEKDDRVEFLLINYDYIDGNDYLARLFQEGYSVGAVIYGRVNWWLKGKLYSNLFQKVQRFVRMIRKTTRKIHRNSIDFHRVSR